MPDPPPFGVILGTNLAAVNDALPADLSTLVALAAMGDERAWVSITDRFAGLVWAVCRNHRLSNSDAADVGQVVWLRLVEHLGRIREPERLAGWIQTTTRNECLRILKTAGRTIPTDDDTELEPAEPTLPAPDARLLTAERDAALWEAFATLPQRCQALLRLLLADPMPPYNVIGETMDMPVGSIGPTRQRCLDRLRRSPHLSRITGDETRSDPS